MNDMASKFKGPQFYTEEDNSIFRGREKETSDLLYLVENSDFSVCYAVSGEGKSSLINAGLCPKLREQGFLPIHIKNIADAETGCFDEFVWQKVKDAIKEEQKKTQYSGISMLKLESKPDSQELSESVWWKLRTREFRLNSFETITPVLIFDQFEEVFGSAKDLIWTDAFFAWLEGLYQDDNPLASAYDGKLKKKFKVLFSLRSEYVCELDYWAMNKYFIPSLKNNRYYLKPLTKAAASEIANLLESPSTNLQTIDIVKYAKSEHTGEWESIKDDIPCVSALILSLILTGLSENDVEIESKIETIGTAYEEGKGKEIFDFLLDNVYKRALQKCGETDNAEVRSYIEVLEDTLIDVNGRRRHVSERELPPITNNNVKEAIGTLEKDRIINVIDNHYEISHDSLCRIVLRRKGERQKKKAEREKLEAERKAELARQEAEEAIRRKNQTEDLTSSFFLLIMYIFITWILSSVYQDKPTFMALLDLNSDHIVKFHNEQLLFNIILGNLVILPILIYSTVKKLRITSWLSVYGLLSNAILLFLFIKGQDNEMGIRTALAVVTIGVPLTTLFYSYLFHINGMPKKEDFKTLFNSIPLIVFFLAVSLYFFYLCIFNDAIGLPNPSDSVWGIVVIPLLVQELLRLRLKQKERLMPLLFLLLSLCLLAYNHLGVSPRYPSYKCIVLIVCSFFASIWQYRNLSPLRCFTSSFIQSIVIIITIVLNNGYNPIRIDFDTVTHVYSWKEVTVKDRTNHIGIAEAFSGDTLIPCVFDSIYNNYLYHSSNRIQYKCDTVDYADQYRYDVKKGEAKYQCLYIPSREQYIYRIANRAKINTTLSDSIQYYAAKTYFELRNSNIDFLQKGNLYAIDAIPSLSFLYKSQIEELDRSLEALKVGEINGKSVADFNKSFARSFYLCLVKDRIVKKDSVNLFSLCQEILPMYFYDSSTDFEITKNSAFNINFGEFHKSYITRIKLSAMRESVGDSKIGNDQRIEAWYHYIEFLTLLDVSLNSSMYASILEKQMQDIIVQTQDRVREIEENMRKQNNRLTKLDELTSKEELTSEQLSEAISLAVEGIKEWDSSNKQITNTKQYVVGELSNLVEERVQIDMDFRQLINKVFLVLPAIVTDTQNIYNADFNNICELLYMVAAVRLYDMSSVYLQELEYMDGAKMKTYVEFKKTQDEKNKMIQKIKDMASTVIGR